MSGVFNEHLLQGRNFLLTGATGGAGSRTALEVSRVGGICHLVARDLDKAGKVLESLHGSGHRVLPHDGGVIDLTGQVQYDGVFHAAGMEMIAPLRMTHGEAVEKVMHASLGLATSILSSTKLVKDGGSIVLMSSVAAVRGTAGMALYSASKAAVEGFSRAAAVELATRRIRVNCIRAGAFASPMHNRIAQRLTPEQMDQYVAKHPLGLGRVEDIANMALYLLSDAGRWITGQAIGVDGGMTAK